MENDDLAGILARFSLLLNSHHDHRKVIHIALEHIKRLIDAEAATLFLLDDDRTELTFWAIQGGAGDKLAGSTMPVRGIAGWVVEKRTSVLVHDAQNDPRFFRDIDSETSFKTNDLLCAPLIVRGDTVIGAIQVINSRSSTGFQQSDLDLLELVSSLTALAVDNARLVTSLKEHSEELEALNKKKGDILSIITHEFRTPLHVIQMSVDLLGSKMLKSPEDEARTFKTLSRAVSLLTRHIVDVKSVSLASGGAFPVEAEAGNLSDTVSEAVSACASDASSRKMSLTFKAPDAALRLQYDPALLFIALYNILRNAIRFTPDGGAITVALVKQSGFARISVTDTGIGIPPDQHEAIFEKFFEGVSIMKHSSGDFSFRSAGLGLGLSTARAIMKAHRGDITVESEDGKGSTFTLLLPA